VHIVTLQCAHITVNHPVQHYNSYRQFLKKKFGTAVLKIPLSGGFSCPNRDGTKSSEGCLFCDNRSFSPAALREENPKEQLLEVIDRVKHKYHAFIPYLQPFSNTYGSVERLREIYEPLLDVEHVVGIAIGTRPDCFGEGTIEYLTDLSSRTFLSVELGLQSAHETTLAAINRGHTVKEFETVVKKLAVRSIETVAHVMLGFPGESDEMMMDTARFLSELPVQGVKIHQVMIIRGTAFETLYNDNKIMPLSLDRYSELLCRFLELLRADQLIHRIVADSTIEHGLIAPLWSAEKSKTISSIHARMDADNCLQGRLYLSR
jgi:radical SAM protein (TIGR01212 family)